MNNSILYTILLILLLLVINIVLFIKIDEINKKITLALIVILAFVIVLNPIKENYKTNNATHSKPHRLVTGLTGLLPKGMHMNNAGDLIISEEGKICVLYEEDKKCYNRQELIPKKTELNVSSKSSKSSKSCKDLKWRTRRDICGASRINGKCHQKKPYAEAKKICEDSGARLCTKDEMEKNITQGTGCLFDLNHNWTSDICDLNNGTKGRWIVKGNSSRTGRYFPPMCVPETQTTSYSGSSVSGKKTKNISVRCCADVLE